MTRRCVYRDCDRPPHRGWTTCAKHYSAGRSTKQKVSPTKPKKEAR